MQNKKLLLLLIMDSDKNRIEIFCDFDGTVTLKDLGDELFKVYGQFDELNSLLKAEKISISEYWYKICETLDTKLTKEIITNFSLQFEIDPYFKDFADYCKLHDINLTLVSDGYREYIEPLLNYHKLGDLPLYANSLDFGTPIKPIFYGADESCNCLSASCKRNVLLTRTPEDAIIVYIGDGYSDFCAAEHSDIIFAKKNLARYCNDNKVPHYPYKTFFDIRNTFEKVIFAKNKIKQRRVAVVKRKQAFETE
jgi:2,3-diketo-5-methylthio-1-phosphopentane phosphatase